MNEESKLGIRVSIDRIEDFGDPDSFAQRVTTIVGNLSGGALALVAHGVRLRCDGCGRACPDVPRPPAGNIAALLDAYRELSAAQGWTHPSDGDDFCPDCSVTP